MDIPQSGSWARDFKLFRPGGKLGSLLRSAADLMHTREDLPLAPSGIVLREAIATMTSKTIRRVGRDGGGRDACCYPD